MQKLGFRRLISDDHGAPVNPYEDSALQGWVNVYLSPPLAAETEFTHAKVNWDVTDAGTKSVFVIYANTGGEPGALLAQSEEVTGLTAGSETLYEFASPVTLAAGQYWLGAIISDESVFGAVHLPWADAYQDNIRQKYVGSPTDVPPDPFGTATAIGEEEGQFPYVMYLTKYSAGAGSPVDFGNSVQVEDWGQSNTYDEVVISLALDTLADETTFDAGHIWWAGGAGSGGMHSKLVVYANSGGDVPGALVGESQAVTGIPAGNTVVDYTFSPAITLPAGRYWLGRVNSNPGVGGLGVQQSGVAGPYTTFVVKSAAYAGSVPNPFGTPDSTHTGEAQFVAWLSGESAGGLVEEDDESKDILRFEVGPLVGVIDGTDITITLPHGSHPSALSPIIFHTGESISPASGAETDFSLPVTYTVTAEDASTQDYVVSVLVEDQFGGGTHTGEEDEDWEAGDMLNPAPFIKPQYFDSDGNPISGGLLYTYAAGTSTLLPTYTTSGGSIANANPVVLDANGQADVWMTPGVNYKFVLKNSSGVIQWTQDNIPSAAMVDNSNPDIAAVDPGGRLTLTTAVPVTTADVTAATTIYYTPYRHNQVPIYDGTTWALGEVTELSQTTADATKSPAGVAVSSIYDLYVWSDSGTMTLSRGPAWTSDTARGTGAGTTELVRVDGRYLNKVSIANGPAASRGTYVGTVRTDASSQINDSLLKRHVWNMYGRTRKVMVAKDTTDTWDYNSATIHQANASTANQLDFVLGLNEDAVSAFVCAEAQPAAGSATVTVAIGLDSTTAYATNCFPGTASISGAAMLFARWEGFAGLGRHYLAWLEQGNGSGTQHWYGDNGDARKQTGISGSGFF